MGKNKNGRRSTGKNKKKETFKKYGKNTARGVRIKQTEMENKEIKINGRNRTTILFLSTENVRRLRENTEHPQLAVYAK
tara:strand:- start:210 stop:446 length:237 start_codon:yes stop_codon:yes gene_type:complete